MVGSWGPLREVVLLPESGIPTQSDTVVFITALRVLGGGTVEVQWSGSSPTKNKYIAATAANHKGPVPRVEEKFAMASEILIWVATPQGFLASKTPPPFVPQHLMWPIHGLAPTHLFSSPLEASALTTHVLDSVAPQTAKLYEPTFWRWQQVWQQGWRTRLHIRAQTSSFPGDLAENFRVLKASSPLWHPCLPAS